MSLQDNLKRYREAAKLTQEELHLKSGVSQQVISDVEQGRTKKPRELHSLAAALGVSVHHLDPERFGPPPSETNGAAPAPVSGGKDLPVYSAAEGGNGVMIVTFEPIDFTRRPPPLESVRDSYAIYIVGDSMAPAYEPGDTALVNPHLPPSPGRDAIFYTEQAGDQLALVKRIIRATAKEWHVQQWNPRKDFTLSRAEYPRCHIVVGKYVR